MDESEQPLGRRERNKRRTRQRLLDSTRELFLEAGAFTTVEEIADRAQVSRATFFNYFPSKDELLQALYLELVGNLDSLVGELLVRDLTTAQRIEGIFSDFVESAERMPAYLISFTAELERLSTPEQVLERSKHLSVQVRRILAEGLSRGEVRTDHDVDFLTLMVCSIYVTSLRFGWQEETRATFGADFVRAGQFAAEAVTAR